MLLEIQDGAFNPQQVVSMVKDIKYNNMGNATRYRLQVLTEHEAFEFIYPNDKQSRDEDFDKIIDAANGKQADTPQTDLPKMTEEEIDTMLARVLVSGQSDCGWK